MEVTRLRVAVGDHLLAIEHIGSTAICGLSAKPIIDIGAAVASSKEAIRYLAPLTELGYEFRGANGLPGRAYFVKGHPRTHHLHVLEVTSSAWANHLAFRDYLCKDDHAAKEYDRVKRQLAEMHPTDRVAYTNGKAPFIQEILRRASEGGSSRALIASRG
jgi:GrpB-like predicted nucleotidyltransferase (UPF0157 family)